MSTRERECVWSFGRAPGFLASLKWLVILPPWVETSASV